MPTSRDAAIDDGARALRSGLATVVAPRDAVRIVGPDVVDFLQGQLSQDIGSMTVDTSTWSLVLAPSGKLDAWVRVTRTASDAVVLDIDPGAGAALLARLRRFLLRTDAEVDVLVPWVATFGPDTPDRMSQPRSTRSVWPGLDVVEQVGPEAPPGADAARRVPVGSLEVVRIEAGVPATGAEIDERVIPAELGQWLIDASVSFTKGCFTGQELVARIDSRGGNVARHLRGLVLDRPAAPGDDVRIADRVVGSVTSAATSPTLGSIALAFVHRSVEPPAVASVGEAGASAEVRTLPLVPARPAGA